MFPIVWLTLIVFCNNEEHLAQHYNIRLPRMKPTHHPIDFFSIHSDHSPLQPSIWEVPPLLSPVSW